MKNTETVIGAYLFCNTGSVLVHAIDGDRVLASINGEDAAWCDVTEEYVEATEELECGFRFGKRFIPFSEVMRV